MMEKDLLTEIRGLKNKLILNNITIDNAVDRFSQLINQFQNDSTYDKEITLFDELSLSEIEKYFLEKNRKAIDRIATLNKILVLQELGIKFSPEELNNLISRNN